MYQTSNRQAMFNLMFWIVFAILGLQLLAIQLAKHETFLVNATI
jgi:hypothetical protein